MLSLSVIVTHCLWPIHIHYLMHLSLQGTANHSLTTDKKTIEEIPPVKSIEKPLDLKPSATPQQQSVENQKTAKVNGKPSGSLSGEGTTSKANLKRYDSEINSSRSFAVIPGSLRSPNTVTGCRYVQSYLVCGSNGIKLWGWVVGHSWNLYLHDHYMSFCVACSW